MNKLWILVLIVGCTQRMPFPNIPVNQDVAFEKDIKPITSKICSECHSQRGNDFKEYENAFKYRHQIYDRVVLSKTMPLGRQMSDEDRALFRDWINQGALK